MPYIPKKIEAQYEQEAKIQGKICVTWMEQYDIPEEIIHQTLTALYDESDKWELYKNECHSRNDN